jgi:hypothetical protein
MKRVIIALLLIVLPTVSHADAINDVMIALKHLNGVVAYGTSHKDYSNYLREAKSEVDFYLKGDEAKKNKKLSVAISEVMDLYEFADSLFSRFEVSKGLINIGTDASPIDKKIASEYFARFPEDKKDVAEGGVLSSKHGVKLHIKTALNKIFKRASVKYADVVKML